MVRVAPISLAHNPRALWFDPGDLEIDPNAHVVVETARGVEFGRMAGSCIEVEESEIKALKSPLKPVLRVADDDDIARAKEMDEKGREALPVFKEMAAELHDDMHPISVEFLLDGDKAVFYFEAEERVDFRELVRRLAARFHVRIDMRQVGVRDEARMIGGLGHCGQELCCKRMGGEFCPVSIRMAKEQDLSLNPQKISGLCGRLMCCLRYEYEAYKDFKQRAPKVGAKIATPEGEAVVTELDVPREEVALKVGDEKPVKVPLSGFEVPEAKDAGEGPVRPKAVNADAWEDAKLDAEGALIGGSLTFLTSQFTGSDKVARGLRARRIDGEDIEKGERQKPGRRRRSRSNSGRSGSSGGSSASRASNARGSSSASETRKPRRRRSTKIADGEVVATERAKQDDKGTATEKGSGSSSSSGSGRTHRRRSVSSRSQGSNQGRQSTSKQNRSSQGKGDGPRPGQHSSGLRNAEHHEGSNSSKQRRSGGQGDRSGRANGSKDRKDGASNANGSGNGRRRRRRRSHSGGSGGSGNAGNGSGGSGTAGSSGSTTSNAPKGDAR